MIRNQICVLDVPVVETERLRLRGHTLGDFAHTQSLWSDEAVTKYIGGKPLTTEECWARFLRYIGHWSLLGFGFWMVEEKESLEFVGEVGFGNFKRELRPSLVDVPEVGWVIATAKQGKGYATEAVGGALHWGQTHFHSSSFACLIHPEHRASIRVATKCGFVPQQMADYKGKPALILRSVSLPRHDS
jgi:RimJ/RimL family protein N-acetyltransferase